MMKIELTNIRNNVLDCKSNPELKFSLEFELQKNIHINVPFYFDCKNSGLFLTDINLSTMKVENKPFKFDLFSKNSLIKVIKEKPIDGMKEWTPDWHSGTFLKGYTITKFMEESEIKSTLDALKSWWDINADKILSKVQENKDEYNKILESSLLNLKIK